LGRKPKILAAPPKMATTKAIKIPRLVNSRSATLAVNPLISAVSRSSKPGLDLSPLQGSGSSLVYLFETIVPFAKVTAVPESSGPLALGLLSLGFVALRDLVWFDMGA
jgi:hypothetical protein